MNFYDIPAFITQNNSWDGLSTKKGALSCDSIKENIKNCIIFILMSIFAMHTSYSKKSEAAIRWGNMFWIGKWKNFVDRAKYK